MSQSLSRAYLHMVNSTKHRIPLLRDKDLRIEMHSYLAGVLKKLDCQPIEAGGADDHIHALFMMSREITIKKVIQETKRPTSIWAKTRTGAWEKFYWQGGCGVISASHSNVPRVRRSIQNQEEHHKKVSFQDEFRALLRRHGIDFDERYVWD